MLLIKWSLIFMSTLIFSVSAYSCELTEEYKLLEGEVITNAELAYQQCISSVKKTKYWYRVSKCMEMGGGLNVGGGCGHLAQGRVEKYSFEKNENIGLNFCSSFKPDSKVLQNYIDMMAKHKGIQQFQ